MDRYGSYLTPQVVVSEAVFQFIRGATFGAVFGMVTPFHAPGTPGARLQAQTLVFKPAPPFSSLRAIPANAAIVGGTLGVQKLTSKSLELIRGKQDWFNEVVGFVVTYRYCTYFLWGAEKRLIMHNRLLGGIIVSTIAYGTFIV